MRDGDVGKSEELTAAEHRKRRLERVRLTPDLLAERAGSLAVPQDTGLGST